MMLSSTYANNSALIGGVISCTGCTIHLQDNTLNYNIALEGGVIYIESEATFYSL